MNTSGTQTSSGHVHARDPLATSDTSPNEKNVPFTDSERLEVLMKMLVLCDVMIPDKTDGKSRYSSFIKSLKKVKKENGEPLISVPDETAEMMLDDLERKLFKLRQENARAYINYRRLFSSKHFIPELITISTSPHISNDHQEEAHREQHKEEQQHELTESEKRAAEDARQEQARQAEKDSTGNGGNKAGFSL